MAPPAGATTTVGLPERLRADAARLYLDAFGAKLGPILGRDARAERFLADVMRPANAVAALGPEGELLGVAGFHDESGSFIGGEAADLRRAFGLVGALWRAPLIALFERDAAPDELLMDGVVVAPTMRGRGVGTLLLDAVAAHAGALGRRRVRLEVVDANPRARALYERRGFAVTSSARVPYLRPIFGFSRADTMTRTL